MTVITASDELRVEHLAACRTFAEVWPRYFRCSAAVQAVVRDLVQLWNNPDIPEEERQRILKALAVTLFTYDHNRLPDRGREELAAVDSPGRAALRERLEDDESPFVANLNRLMKEKNLTQAELAQKAGLSQPAISMMLARKYRPQGRTIRLIAQVLEVEVSALWPPGSVLNKEELPKGVRPQRPAKGTRKA